MKKTLRGKVVQFEENALLFKYDTLLIIQICPLTEDNILVILFYERMDITRCVKLYFSNCPKLFN